jgi:hypothetical protein
MVQPVLVTLVLVLAAAAGVLAVLLVCLVQVLPAPEATVEHTAAAVLVGTMVPPEAVERVVRLLTQIPSP